MIKNDEKKNKQITTIKKNSDPSFQTLLVINNSTSKSNKII
jgi:hypothetical protein